MSTRNLDVAKMDTLGFEPRAFHMRSGCDTTTPCAQLVEASPTMQFLDALGRPPMFTERQARQASVTREYGGRRLAGTSRIGEVHVASRRAHGQQGRAMAARLPSQWCLTAGHCVPTMADTKAHSWDLMIVIGTSGLVAMTSASHAEGRQFDPGLVYFWQHTQPTIYLQKIH